MSAETPGQPYKRILLKLSGEVLAGSHKSGFDFQVIKSLVAQVAEIVELGIEVVLVIGGGNIFRGQAAAEEGMDRVTADYMGMMATIINGHALQDFLEQAGLVTRLQTAIEIKSVAEPFIRRKAFRHLEKKRVVIMAGGTGNPYFTTDTTAALRAVELNADIIFKATKVDGIYEEDPVKNPDARRYSKISYIEAIQKQLKVMDMTAFSLCMDNSMPIQVFDINAEYNLKRAVQGEDVGTLVSDQEGCEYYEC
jgi:uridylate kinase